jgi:hypothetical protein
LRVAKRVCVRPYNTHTEAASIAQGSPLSCIACVSLSGSVPQTQPAAFDASAARSRSILIVLSDDELAVSPVAMTSRSASAVGAPAVRACITHTRPLIRHTKPVRGQALCDSKGNQSHWNRVSGLPYQWVSVLVPWLQLPSSARQCRRGEFLPSVARPAAKDDIHIIYMCVLMAPDHYR